MRGNLVRTTALIIAGGILFNATPAWADLPTIDVITHFLITQLQNAATSAINKVESAVTGIGDRIVNQVLNLGDTMTDVMTRGFTQQSNYQKASVGAQMQIADASNAAQHQVGRDTRNAQIVVEHTPSPEQCLDNQAGQMSVSASVAAVTVARSIGSITDNRGEAVEGQPAFYGQAQAVQAINNLHASRYCSKTEADAGLCSVTPLASADQHSWNFLGDGSYDGQDGINAANDFATNVVQPIVPAALRASQLTSVTGQDGWVRRRSYNARMSLARGALNYAIGIQAPVVTLNADQKKQMVNEGLPATDKASWLQATTMEVNRRFSGLQWAANLQQMPPATVQREIATELALANYLALQNYRVGLWNATLAATQVAQHEEATFKETVAMPSPDMN